MCFIGIVIQNRNKSADISLVTINSVIKSQTFCSQDYNIDVA